MRLVEELSALREPGVARPLDTAEATFWVLSQRAALQPALIAIVEGPLDEGLVGEALRRLGARHPILRSKIVQTAQGPAFTPAADPPGLWFVRRGADPTLWRIEAERALHVAFGPEDPLPWRLGLVQGPDPQGPHALVLSIHPSVSDGLGAMRALSDLLAFCDETQRRIPFGEGLPPLAPTPPLDAVLGPAPTRRDRLRHGMRALGDWMRRERAWTLPVEGVASPSERRTGALFGELPVQTLARLVANAREHRCSLSSVFGAAAVETLGALLGHGSASLSTEVSLRSRCSPAIPPHQLGCFAAHVVSRRALRDERPFWTRAEELHAELMQRLARHEPQASLAARRGRIAALERRMEALAVDRELQGRFGALRVTNRGVLPAAPGKFHVRALYAPAAVHVLGPSLHLSFATVAAALCCTLTYPRPLVGERTATAFLRELSARLAFAAA